MAALPTDTGKIERIFRIWLESFAWNCPEHITPRFAEDEVNGAVRPLRDRLGTLEAQAAGLRARLASANP